MKQKAIIKRQIGQKSGSRLKKYFLPKLLKYLKASDSKDYKNYIPLDEILFVLLLEKVRAYIKKSPDDAKLGSVDLA